MPSERSLEEWSSLLGDLWERRSRLPSRDLFVSSHPGWNDPGTWRSVAERELALYLTGLDDTFLKSSDVLEIGCGSGRLAELLAPRVASYTGFDIAPGMVEAARERCSAFANVRVLIGDGIAVPEQAHDREYHLALAAAVFIHCPRRIIRSLVESTMSCLGAGGQLRFQVRADPADHTGIKTPNAEKSTAVLEKQRDRVRLELSDEELELTRGSYYMGDRFGFEEARAFFLECSGAAPELYRGDRAAIYGMVEKN